VRIRTIKPEWLLSRSVASLSADARLLSVGLILMADDEGRGRAGLETIVAEVWRYHAGPQKCEETYRTATVALRELSDAGFVVLYEVDGTEYFCLPSFARHQVINKKSSSKIPAPYLASGRTTVAVPEDYQTEQGTGIRDQGKEVEGEGGASASAASDADAAAKAEEEAAKRAAALRYRKLVTLGWKTASDAMKANGHGGHRSMTDDQDACWREFARWALRTERARAAIGQTVSAEDAIAEAVQEWVSGGSATGSGWNPQTFCNCPDRYFLKDGIKAREAWKKRAGLK
jgi:hypothetical protein